MPGMRDRASQVSSITSRNRSAAVGSSFAIQQKQASISLSTLGVMRTGFMNPSSAAGVSHSSKQHVKNSAGYFRDQPGGGPLGGSRCAVFGCVIFKNSSYRFINLLPQGSDLRTLQVYALHRVRCSGDDSLS